MLSRNAIALTTALALMGGIKNTGVGPAVAAHAKPPTPACKTIAAVKALLANGAHFTPVTPGQFHFLQGLYVALPDTPPGLPPGNGALLVQRDGEPASLLLWTRGNLACAPLGLPATVVKMLRNIKSGALDEDGDEL
jgi:hypothetical protein